MVHGELKNIEHGVFRANPRYELILFDHLSPEHQAALSDLRNDPDFYGILQPRDQSGLSIKAVCRDAALLYLTLREAGHLPTYIGTVFREGSNKAISQLVLDGVLEIEQDGTFVSGAAVYGLIFGNGPSFTRDGRISRLSIEAVKYGQALQISDATKLSARMYFYNRLPVSPSWKQLFPTSSAVADHLGLNTESSTERTLRQNWSSVTLPPSYDGWFMWESRHARLALRESRLTYKVYVSPDPKFIRDGFHAAVQVLTQLRVPSFKIGKDVYGVLRPDKIVAYFWSFEELQEAADRLRDKLQGCPAHGVPFTAEITTDGLLSWGMDPPREQQALGWRERESWRLWLTNRLATALVAAKAAQPTDAEPWQFALERLQLDGIDTTTWTPTNTPWRGDPGVATK